MKKILLALFFSVSALSAEDLVENDTSLLTSEDEKLALLSPTSPNAKEVASIADMSKAFGHLMGRNLEALGVKLDIAQVIKGLEDAAAGKDSPMTDMECIQAINVMQENNFKQQAIDNLKKANEFLLANSKKTGVIILEDGKLQYKIDKEGSGSTIEEHTSALIRYSGKLIDGTVCEASEETSLMSLDETLITGFAKGIIGMKEGERRTLYIHPDLGYPMNAGLPPNSLVTFEVEVVKANVSPQETQDALSKDKFSPEMAGSTSPVDAKTVIR